LSQCDNVSNVQVIIMKISGQPCYDQKLGQVKRWLCSSLHVVILDLRHSSLLIISPAHKSESVML